MPDDLKEIPDVALRLLSIRGIEVTQGIQRYRSSEHLTDPLDQGPDNSVRFVAGKPAWVRVYLRGLFFPISNVAGTLTVHREVNPGFWLPKGQIDPQPPGAIRAETSLDYATERGDITRSLNFIVPADVMCGHLRLKVDVQSSHYSTSRTIEIDVSLRQTLRMRIVPVSYDGTDAMGNPLTLDAPTQADAVATAGWSLLVYPVQSTPDITLTASVELTFPLTGAPANPGGCAQSWLDLNALVAQARTADGNVAGAFYYGLVPVAVPIGSNSGCASSGVTSGRVNGGVTMAHEFGHALGYPHAPCGNVGTGDQSFPAYEPYDPANAPGASIGEYGIDISDGTVKSPVDFRDYMSYCGPRWISLFNYQRSIDHQTLNPTTACPVRRWWWWNEVLVDPWWWLKRPSPIPDPPPWFDEVMRPVDARQPVFSIIGIRDLTGKIEIRSVTRTLASPELSGAVPTDAVVELLGDDGETLAAATVHRLPSHGDCGCHGGGDAGRGPYVFQVMLPDPGRGRELRMSEGREELWRYEAPDTAPTPPRVEVEVRDRLRVRWSVAKGDEKREVWVLCRPAADKEAEPQTLLVATGGGEGEVALETLRSGPVQISAVVHDGFHRGESEPVEVEIPAVGPALTILHPYERRTLEAGRTMRLQGVVNAQGGGTIDPSRVQWRIDGVEVATELDTFVAAPESGRHEATLTVTTDAGNAEASVTFTTLGGEEERESPG